ncbi:hypothetical protein MTO96_014388 [Rhipicephalus appendiculatus]
MPHYAHARVGMTHGSPRHTFQRAFHVSCRGVTGTGRDELLHSALIHREASAASAASISADVKAIIRGVVDAWSLRSSGRQREVGVFYYAMNVCADTVLCGGLYS